MSHRTRSHIAANQANWNRWAEEYAAPGERSWADPAPSWGIFEIPETDAGALPADLGGKDVVELGCGTAYVSAWLARLAARPVGVDLSANQLATARRLQRHHGIEFPLIL